MGFNKQTLFCHFYFAIFVTYCQLVSHRVTIFYHLGNVRMTQESLRYNSGTKKGVKSPKNDYKGVYTETLNALKMSAFVIICDGY